MSCKSLIRARLILRHTSTKNSEKEAVTAMSQLLSGDKNMFSLTTALNAVFLR